MALTFVGPESAAHLRLIEKRCHLRLHREQVAGFEPTGNAPEPTVGAPPVKGKRKSKKDKLREASTPQTSARSPPMGDG